MIAPAIMGQLPCSPKQLKQAILSLGFSDVVEVAEGADITTKKRLQNLLKEWKEETVL